MLMGLFAIMGSQLVDSAFVGQLGAEPLAVMGFTIPIYQVVVGVQVGLGIATTASISNALGGNKSLYAKYLGTLILILGAMVITLLCVSLWVYQESIASFLGADAALFPMLRDYWLPWLMSCWFGAFLYFGYSICRSHGDNALSGKIMVITSVLNLGLDPLFIFTLDMGIAGAAWATCLSFLIGCFIIFRVIIKKKQITSITDIKQAKGAVASISRIAFPATLSQFLPPISAILVTMVIANYDDYAVGAWGLANRIEYMSIILILALTMALPPMIGKLKGMNKLFEIVSLVKTAVILVILFQFLLAVVLLVTSSPVASLLAKQTDIASLLTSYLWFVPISYGALGVCMICVSACNAMGQSKFALLISMLRLFACYLPLIWLGSEMYGVMGIFIGATLGNFLSGVVGWAMFVKQHKALVKS
ncbi:MATE family efflux transporter [Marinomonas sp. GJ51-6]|uniref:MATE family efflux transporter n=1 Tax=Marinomonas sp. GJ51-6 TaxID=2992802 RepID=UPI002934FAAB|nr:MATE family efflux transporter [Marinomonas sp. GJ51-6]WOD07407.1 MATE family efflux transporter [Marinomonas sp. GJ51-6]